MTSVVEPAAGVASETELRADLAAVDAEFATFRQRVRSEILRQHFDGPWCLPGAQGALRDLDLPPIALAFTGSATVHVHITDVEGASDYQEAEDRVIRALGAASSDDSIDFELEYVSADLQQREVQED